MIRGPGPRDRRALLAGLGAIALVLLLTRGVPAWGRWDSAARASAAEMEREAALAEEVARHFAPALDSLEARRDRLVAYGETVLAGGSPSASGAELAALVSGAAARAGVETGAVQLRADTASGVTFRRVSVRLDGTGDLGGILRLLRIIEGGPERLVVRELAIHQPHAGGPAEQPESLRLEMTIEALAFATAAGTPSERRDRPADVDPAMEPPLDESVPPAHADDVVEEIIEEEVP
jgi:hypothetical protein